MDDEEGPCELVFTLDKKIFAVFEQKRLRFDLPWQAHLYASTQAKPPQGLEWLVIKGYSEAQVLELPGRVSFEELIQKSNQVKQKKSDNYELLVHHPHSGLYFRPFREPALYGKPYLAIENAYQIMEMPECNTLHYMARKYDESTQYPLVDSKEYDNALEAEAKENIHSGDYIDADVKETFTVYCDNPRTGDWQTLVDERVRESGGIRNLWMDHKWSEYTMAGGRRFDELIDALRRASYRVQIDSNQEQDDEDSDYDNQKKKTTTKKKKKNQKTSAASPTTKQQEDTQQVYGINSPPTTDKDKTQI